MKKYICIATVTVKAPANYQPRTSTYKLVCYAKGRGFRAKDVEQEALRYVKECLTDANPGLDLKFSVSSRTETIFGIRTYESLKKEQRRIKFPDTVLSALDLPKEEENTETEGECEDEQA